MGRKLLFHAKLRSTAKHLFSNSQADKWRDEPTAGWGKSLSQFLFSFFFLLCNQHRVICVQFIRRVANASLDTKLYTIWSEKTAWKTIMSFSPWNRVIIDSSQPFESIKTATAIKKKQGRVLYWRALATLWIHKKQRNGLIFVDIYSKS